MILQRKTLEEVTRHQRQWVSVVGGREPGFFVFALTCGLWDLCVCVAVLGPCCWVGFPLVAASKGLLSSCAAWASLAAEHSLEVYWLQQFQHLGSVAAVPRF